MLTPDLLKLKIGARVMLTKNDPAKNWVNGSQGVLKQVSDCKTKLKIELDSGSTIELKKITLSNNNSFNYCSVDQFPLTLAYALTIHKSQGLTVDKLIVDFTGDFGANSMAYVALSRVKNSADLIVKGFNKKLIKCDQRALAFEKVLLCKSLNVETV
jgi:ATP-dependent exoDNAse (exonuclease V) alpha subunit